MGLFFLLTLYCAIRFFEPPGRRGWCTAALVAFVLGLGSKEVIVVAPAIVLVYDWLFWSTSLARCLPTSPRALSRLRGLPSSFSFWSSERGCGMRSPASAAACTPWDYVTDPARRDRPLPPAGRLAASARRGLRRLADRESSVTAVLPSLLVVAALVALTLWGLSGASPSRFSESGFSRSSLRRRASGPSRRRSPRSAGCICRSLRSCSCWSSRVQALLRWAGAPRGGGIGLGRRGRRDPHGRHGAPQRGLPDDISPSGATSWRNARTTRERDIVRSAKYFYDHGRMAEAYEHFSTAVRLDPKDGLAQFGLGAVLDGQGKRDEAIDRYRNFHSGGPPERARAQQPRRRSRESWPDRRGDRVTIARRSGSSPTTSSAHYNLATGSSGEGPRSRRSSTSRRRSA